MTVGGNNVSRNSAFANPLADDYHLNIGSPAINMGADTGVMTDFEGDARPYEGGFDIGYDEWTRRIIFLPLVMKGP